MPRLLEVLWPLTARADRLGAIELFHEFRWPELEAAAALFEPVEAPRGTRLTVQGRLDTSFWLISEGQALVSADARPLRVIGRGDAAGVPGMLYSIASPETTIALSPVRALTAGRDEFERLVSDARIRRRLTAVAADRLWPPRPAKPR